MCTIILKCRFWTQLVPMSTSDRQQKSVERFITKSRWSTWDISHCTFTRYHLQKVKESQLPDISRTASEHWPSWEWVFCGVYLPSNQRTGFKRRARWDRMASRSTFLGLSTAIGGLRFVVLLTHKLCHCISKHLTQLFMDTVQLTRFCWILSSNPAILVEISTRITEFSPRNL